MIEERRTSLNGYCATDSWSYTAEIVGGRPPCWAANAAACVANFSPDSYFDVNRALLDRQPKKGAAAFTDRQLTRVVAGVDGIESRGRIANCITSGTYEPWVADATERAADGPISDASITKIASTPTILVNGQEYKYSTPFTGVDTDTVGSGYSASDPAWTSMDGMAVRLWIRSS